MRRFAIKYRESVKKGSISVQMVGAFELKNKTKVLQLNARVKFPNAEEKSFNKFKELRKFGIKVDGNYLKAKMLKYVAMKENANSEKVKTFRANNR